jgi:hypothetical protein
MKLKGRGTDVGQAMWELLINVGSSLCTSDQCPIFCTGVKQSLEMHSTVRRYCVFRKLFCYGSNSYIQMETLNRYGGKEKNLNCVYLNTHEKRYSGSVKFYGYHRVPSRYFHWSGL